MVAVSTRRAHRFRRVGLGLGLLATLQLVAFSWCPIADLIARPLEQKARTLAAEAPRKGYAVILLLGGVGSPPPIGSARHLELSSAASRIWLAARLFHAEVAPRIIVSGGSFPMANGTALMPEAESIRPLLQELGVPIEAIALEPRSLNTRENAKESRRLIGESDNVALVTSAFHMPRAIREMRRSGINAYAFPTDFRIAPERRSPLQQWLPNPGALELSTLAIKEWLGMWIHRQQGS